MLDKMAQRLPGFIKVARKAGVPIIWTRMIEDPNYMTDNYKEKMEIEDTPVMSTPETQSFEMSDSDQKLSFLFWINLLS